MKFNLAKNIVAGSDTLPKGLVLINTCYDHVLVPVKDKRGFDCGSIDITDRQKLLTLFKNLKRENNYRYIVCDISFDRRFRTPYDKELFTLLASMRDCIVPSLSGVSLPTQLDTISCVSEYGISVVNNDFLKYQYLQNGVESTALRMARDIDGIDYTKHGIFYFIDGKLCVNSHIVDIKYNVTEEYMPSGGKNILQLGTEVIPMAEAGISDMYKDKIIMIGDCFKEDIHNTVAGRTSGLMIIYNSYLALKSKQNVVAWWFILLVMIAYYVITWLIVSKNAGDNEFLMNVVIYVLMGAIIMLFIFTGSYIDALAIIVYFGLLKRIIKWYKIYRNKV